MIFLRNSINSVLLGCDIGGISGLTVDIGRE